MTKIDVFFVSRLFLSSRIRLLIISSLGMLLFVLLLLPSSTTYSFSLTTVQQKQVFVRCNHNNQQQRQQLYHKKHCQTNKYFVSSSVLLFGSREDEIAKLQEQLRQLQQEAEKEAGKGVVQQEEEKGAKTPTTLTPEQQRTLEIMKGKDMILSEKELIQIGIVDSTDTDAKSSNNNNSDGGIGSMLVPVLGTLLALIVVVGFAQIPIGQDTYNQYSEEIGINTASPIFKTIDLGDINPDKK